MRKKFKVGDKIKISKKAINAGGILSKIKKRKAVVVSLLDNGVIGLIRNNAVYREYYHEKFWELEDK